MVSVLFEVLHRLLVALVDMHVNMAYFQYRVALIHQTRYFKDFRDLNIQKAEEGHTNKK